MRTLGMPTKPPSIVIGSDGGISVAGSVVIDGHSNVSQRVRVVTHIHSDHTVNLQESISSSYRLVATQLTLSWLQVFGYSATNYLSLEAGDSIRLGDLRLRFLRSLHIPGTVQVFVETDDGTRVLYSSDFKKPGEGTPVEEADVLVIDAVYGRPSYVREFDDYIEYLLVDLVKQLLTEGGVRIYGYYGKVNEVMSILRQGGVDAPFVLPPKVYMMTKKAESLGIRVGDYVLAGSRESQEVIRDGWYVYLDHSSRFTPGSRDASTLVLSGWEFRNPIRKISSRTWHVAFSDHSDFRGLVKYVSSVRPRKLYVVKARSSGAEEFAAYVAKNLGIREVYVV
jgi:putative mRNA 3-end processing factor